MSAKPILIMEEHDEIDEYGTRPPQDKIDTRTLGYEIQGTNLTNSRIMTWLFI